MGHLAAQIITTIDYNQYEHGESEKWTWNKLFLSGTKSMRIFKCESNNYIKLVEARANCTE